MKTLGIWWIVYGVGRLAGAAGVFVWNTTLILMFGALLVRVPNPYSLMTLFHVFLIALIALGIIGEYVGSIHTTVLNRPLVTEKERINF